MTSKVKLFNKIFNNPKNIHFIELNSILLELGYERRQSGKGSSHYVYSHPNIDMLVVLVSHGKNDVLPEYQVKKAIQSIRILQEEK
ncbi:MAG: hypothetical protein A2X61_14345 [Ignavibacteria bacterium GWB2_35_12]|nr:MAG: hypothetical protein A2X63_04495 [Ignavibacteria bacterium GWA2_35_8]OGU41084.1 MAG: hypothetical protein A2X61_14345 [Ignavibacteria bacterium GWB2_35_12]OGU86211.1 MAG: hypothetical protein A2220_14190 [Ignavibacteria bacterium RIFOXYA2_FULL_35_10]OGV22901.1 MAG: hypothetical protein A2475_10510 [Ignavibacteria bacterium RIFOXYC2_FULL_35_21]